MLVVTGIFDNEKFIPDNPVSIPQKKKVEITINEISPVTITNKNNRQAIFDKYRLDLTKFKFDRDEANNYE